MTVDPTRIHGTLYGQAIGDSLGIPIEFKSKVWIVLKYGADGAGPYQFEACRGFKAGEWSDDTAMAVAILQTYLDHQKVAGKILPSREGYIKEPLEVPPQKYAKAFWNWLINDGRGSGNLTRNVLTDPKFLQDPHDAAHRVWVRRAMNAAANGAVMRTSYVGLMQPEDLDWTEKAAVNIARVTHYDPRCVASAVAVSIAVACLVTGKSTLEALDEAEKRACQYHPEVGIWMDQTLEELDLDEGLDDAAYKGRPPIGYTYKTMGAAFWALRQSVETPDFMECLAPILWEGGDTDTNAAVAGALLGAALGFESIPEDLSSGVYEKDLLETFQRALTA